MIVEISIYIIIIIITFLFMECVAWFLHKYVMHGFGWIFHEDHHRQSKGKLEKNDIFGVFFSLLSFFLILFGFLNGYNISMVIGIGVAFYGIAYLMVHDIFFHKRIKIKYKPKSKYMKRVLKAHSIHHQKSKPNKGICFGFLYASKSYG